MTIHKIKINVVDNFGWARAYPLDPRLACKPMHLSAPTKKKIERGWIGGP